MLAGPGVEIVDADRGDRVLFAEHGAAEGLAGPGGRVEMIVDDIVGKVAGLAQFLQDDVLLAGEVAAFEMRLADEVADQFDAEVEMLA